MDALPIFDNYVIPALKKNIKADKTNLNNLLNKINKEFQKGYL
tara:strand:- start:1146 stop:1274 length:129 start_codon:yes stop_codon:yes gene_type:complete